MRILPLLFHCFFYTGSWVKEEKYKDLLRTIENHPPVEQVQVHKPFQTPPNNSILIGHSLGGYFALRDAQRHPDRVQGVILIHSHFNSRGVMPYSSVKTHDIHVPVLTILAGKDERLPIRKAMDDAWECAQENEMDKYFVVNRNLSHFSGVTTKKKQENIVKPILEFIDALDTRNFSSIRKLETYRRRFQPELYYLSPNALIASQSVNIIDAILRVVGPRSLWQFLHFLWFLTTKPNGMGILFVDDNHIYLKGKKKDKKYYRQLLHEWTREVPTKIHDQYLPQLHPSILFWLLCPLTPRQQGNMIIAPRLILEVGNETVYYKVPNPRKFFSLLPDESFFDFRL